MFPPNNLHKLYNFTRQHKMITIYYNNVCNVNPLNPKRH